MLCLFTENVGKPFPLADSRLTRDIPRKIKRKIRVCVRTDMTWMLFIFSVINR